MFFGLGPPINSIFGSRINSHSTPQPQIKSFSDIDKHYEQLGCLAHGGFASVFLARKRSSGRRVAIKSFHMDVISKENIRRDDYQEDHDLPESFTREMRIVKKLQTQTQDWLGSSNSTSECDDRGLSIVFYEQWFSGQNFAGAVMNYCDGGNLAQEIDAKFRADDALKLPYSERRIAWYILQLSEALAYSHERGVYHHDVKSSNILIDWSSGGKILLADFGSAIGAREESFSMSEVYASPELQAAYANINNNSDDNGNEEDADSPEGVYVDGDKVDSFGLGCILFELLCCRRLVDLMGEDTLGEIISKKGVEAALSLECLKLPWLPNDEDENKSNSQLIGYSFALHSLAKTFLAPDPNMRWSVSQLQGPLRKDPKSPLLSKFVAASYSPVSGEPVTVDNVQLGMFVQRSRDWVPERLENPPFNQPYVVTHGIDTSFGSTNVHSITAMPQYEGYSYEELRLSYYMEKKEKHAEVDKADEGDIGVVVKLDPDGGYTEAIFPSYSKLPSTYRIGSNNKFELQIGPSLTDFFSTSERPGYTGLLSAKSLTRMLGRDKPEDLPVGHLLTNNCMLVTMDNEQDIAIVAPIEKSSPIVTELRSYYPLRTISYVDPTKPQSPPEHWQTSGNILVEENDTHQREAVNELFYSDGGGMDIQAHEIISIKRVQSIELWSSYSQSRVDIAAANWGVCNEHRLFLGTGQHNPEKLLSDPTSFFYNYFHSDGVTFSNSPSHADKHCYSESRSNEKQIVVSRVALGRIKDRADFACSSISHSIRKIRGKGVFTIKNTNQAVPEYIITYRRLHDPSSTNRFNFTPHSTSFPVIYPPTTVSFSSQGVFSFSPPSQHVAPNPPMFLPQSRFSFGTPTSHNITDNHDNSGNSSNTGGLNASRNSVITSNTQGNHQPGISFEFHPSTTTNLDNDGVKGSISNIATSDHTGAMQSITLNATTSSNVASDQKRSNTEKEEDEKKQISIKQCVVCLEKDVRRVCLPCGHTCLCEICSTAQGLRKLRRKCPECRSIIKQVVTIYARVVDG